MKERLVYNVDAKWIELMRFLQFNQIDTYNFGMRNVDIADQLRGFYCVNIWLRNRKWWWSILFWAFSVCITNVYILYVKVCDEECVPQTNRHTQYELRKEAGLFWLNHKLMEREDSNKKKGCSHHQCWHLQWNQCQLREGKLLFNEGRIWLMPHCFLLGYMQDAFTIQLITSLSMLRLQKKTRI